MKTPPELGELEQLEAINRDLCQKIVDLEAEIERKNTALEGFIAENEALKAELGGKKSSAPGKEKAANGKDAAATVPGDGQEKSGPQLENLVARARRLGW